MASLPTRFRFRYVFQKIRYSGSTFKDFGLSGMFKTLFLEKMTYIQKGKDSSPTMLVRRLPTSHGAVEVGDMVVYKDRERKDKHLVGRLIGLEESKKTILDEKKNKPIVDCKNESWIVPADLKKAAVDAKDAKTHSPIMPTKIMRQDIVGRVIYSWENYANQGVVETNSLLSKKKDLPVVKVELDMHEMNRIHRLESAPSE